MNPSTGIRSFTEKRCAGFALVAALCLCSCVLLIGLSLSAMLTIQLAAGGSHREKIQAHMNAAVAAKIALGQLQAFAGRDCVATMPAGPNDGRIVAAFGTGENPRIPLFSCNDFLNTNNAPFGTVKIATEEKTTFRELPEIVVPWLADGENGTGRFAFCVSDESQKVDIGTFETRESLALDDLQMRRQLCAQRTDADLALKIIRAEQQLWRENLADTITPKNLRIAWMAGAGEEEIFPLSARLYTPASFGIPANAAEGGLRINWDRKMPLARDELPCSPAAWNAFFRPEPAFEKNPAGGLPVKPIAPENALRRFPILSGLHVRFGFFNTRSDGFHRTRFTVGAQLWNPTPYPLVCTDAARIALLDFEKMPTVEIINHDTGSNISVNMGNFPVGQFGLAKQTPSDTTANAYLELLDGRRFGMTGVGLLAGEVYNFAMPNPVAQPQGLARVLSGTTWKMQTDPKKPTKPPSGANGNNWFHAAHKIEIRGTMPAGGVTLHLREARGTLPSQMQSKDYSSPALTLKNIPWKNFSKILSGEEYNRAQSTTYATGEARIAFSLKLKNDSPETIAQIFETLDPREPVLDFADPRVAGLYKIETDPVDGLNVPLATKSDENFLWDADTNDHGEESAGDAFSEMRSLDRPTARPVSVGALRHLPLENKSAGSLNAKYPQNRETDAAWFDRAFFAGARPEETEKSDDTKKRPWSRNPRLVRDADSVTAEDADIAAHCRIRGAFNVNCIEPEVWRTQFARTLPEWKRKPPNAKNEKPPPTKKHENAFFRLPFGAPEPRMLGSDNCDFSDKELKKLSPENFARVAGMQGFRALENELRDKLASALSEKIADRQQTAGAFRSLADFAQSGVLADAIKAAGCNSRETLGAELPAHSPLRLNAGDILESLLPVLATRGDTFRVRVVGATSSPVTKKTTAQARAEIVVQRLPEFLDDSQPAMTPPAELNALNKTYGRRMKIISWRILDAGEE